ncbi:MAG: aminotransferase [Alphaproteobacteria bacterium]|nr:aminotransferase [Alphaproteobacteria bacterium]
MKQPNALFAAMGTSIFEVMSLLAKEHDSINLGQGFPSGNGPADVRAKAAEALEDRPNQYPPMMGVPELRQAVAAHDKRFYGLDVDWQREVLVTTGATEGLLACLLGLLNPGDEVVLFEPLYDSYVPILRRGGAVPRYVRLEPPAWELRQDRLEAAFSPRTKLVLLNNPHNPAGKVYTREELGCIAELVIRYDAYAVCDEVYEHIVFDGRRHIPLITLPGMRERSVHIGSAGKTFSLTGWKVGYCTAAPALIQTIARAHQFLVFTTAPNLQRAVAYGLGKDDAYYRALAGDMQEKRDRLAHGLGAVGFTVLDSGGTYFINADFRPLGFNGGDEAFCTHITEQAKVTALPVSAFYAGGGVEHLARFCFAKEDHVLDEAVARLGRLFR